MLPASLFCMETVLVQLPEVFRCSLVHTSTRTCLPPLFSVLQDPQYVPPDSTDANEPLHSLLTQPVPVEIFRRPC